jgi:hypothetical protein
MGTDLMRGDIVRHPKCPAWGQGRVLTITADKIEARFLDADPQLRLLSSRVQLHRVAQVDRDPRFDDSVAENLTESTLWEHVCKALEDERIRGQARGEQELIIRTTVQSHPNLICVGDNCIYRRSMQANGKWGDRQRIPSSSFWLVASLAVEKGEHVLEDTPSGGYFGCIACTILDLLPWFACIAASAGRRQRIVYRGAKT